MQSFFSSWHPSDNFSNYSLIILFRRLLPEMVATILSDSVRRESVLLQCDASEVLRDAFLQTEACMNYHYEVFSHCFPILFILLLVERVVL